jgi:hypothetical protein
VKDGGCDSREHGRESAKKGKDERHKTTRLKVSIEAFHLSFPFKSTAQAALAWEAVFAQIHDFSRIGCS